MAKKRILHALKLHQNRHTNSHKNLLKTKKNPFLPFFTLNFKKQYISIGSPRHALSNNTIQIQPNQNHKILQPKKAYL
jgi:hypothetical protein